MSLTATLRSIFGLTDRDERRQALEKLKQEIKKGDVARSRTSAQLANLDAAVKCMESAFSEQTKCFKKMIDQENNQR